MKLSESQQAAYNRGVEKAKADVVEMETPECGAFGSHASMPCGCCWHTAGHNRKDSARPVCPRVEHV